MREYSEKQLVQIEPSFLIFLCACYYFDPAGFFWPFLMALSAHEGGHLLALTAVGCPVRHLCFTAVGAIMETEECSYLKEALVAATGPAMNLLLFALSARRTPVAALVNLVIFFYNLLPFYPLDGGRLLRCALHLLLPDGVAARTEEILHLFFALNAIFLAGYLTFCKRGGALPCAILLLLFIRIRCEKKKEKFFQSLWLTNCGNRGKMSELHSERCPSGLRSRS